MKLIRRVHCGLIAGVLAIGVASGPAPAADAGLPTWYVDPARGQDDELPGRGQSQDLPFASIPFALQAAAGHVAAPDYRGPRGASLQLSAAVLTVEPPGLRLALAPELEDVVLEGPAGGEAVLRVEEGLNVRGLEAHPAATSISASLTLRRVAFVFGATALGFYPPAGVTSRLTIEDCRFLRQAADSVLVPVAPGARASVIVRRTRFEQGLGGLSVLYGTGSAGEVTVEDCSFDRLRRYAGSGVLGAAIDVHLGERASVSVRVARCSIQGAGSAVQLTTAEEDPGEAPSAGQLTAEIVNNLIEGSGPRDIQLDRILSHGIYLSLWPHHQLAIGIRNNTFAHVRGHVLHNDNAAFHAERGTAPPLTFANNIAWQIGASSEFDLESMSLEAEPEKAWLPPAGMVLRSNLLEKSRLGRERIDGNFTGDPLFEAPENGSYGIPLESPAVDRGDVHLGTQDDLDFARGCRRSSAGCDAGRPEAQPIDVGAFEHPQSHCHADLVPFRRGDCTRTGSIDVTDAIYLFGFLFLGTESPSCNDACDANDDAELNISDGVSILGYLFSGSRPPAPPSPEAGLDPTRDCHPSCK